ncbi:MAG: BamA/TamA family outer membrane protein [Pseudomonadota bacterium]
MKPSLLLALSFSGLVFLTPVSAQENVARQASEEPAAPTPTPPPGPEEDAELGEELESVEDFERRLERQFRADDTVPPDTDDSAPPPLGDPELGKPLPPLGEFALPVGPVIPALDQTELDEEALRYRWEITGLSEADGLADIDLLDRFETLSALEQGRGRAANTAMLIARLADDQALLTRILKAHGWYGAVIEKRLDPAPPEDNRGAIARLAVDPGARFALADIRIEAEPTAPADLIESALKLAPGDPIVASAILANEALIAKTLPENGYPFARLGERDVLLDAQSATGIYTLPVETGPRARVSGFSVSGEQVFDADHIADIARITPGDLYDSRYVDDLRRALIATGLLRSFSVEPESTGEVDEDGVESVTLRVDQTAGPARTIAGTVGYGTGQGFRLEGSWAHRNLFPPEGALTASLIAGTLEQGASLTFRRANAGKRDRSFEISASALRSNFDAFEATTGRIGALYSYVSTPIWQKRVTYAIGAEALASVEEAFDSTTNTLEEETYLIGVVTGQIGFDTSDDLLNPTRGLRLEALVQPEGSLAGDFTPYVRTIIDASAYTPISESVVIAGRARLGSLLGADRVDIAPSRRIYAGGGGSVRGFGFQELGPQGAIANPDFDPSDPDETDDPFLFTPIGGRSVVEASAEMRYRFGDYGVVAFVDAGQVYTDTAPALRDIRFGVGLGARVYTGFGPIRVDVATPINRRAGESRINLYVSIGQAF